MDSEGQRRMAALHAGGAKRGRADLEIAPNLWAGVGLVRGGAGTALAFGIHARKGGLGACNGVVVDAADEFFGGLPGGVFGLAHDHVQADAELHAAALALGAGAHIGDLLRHLRGRLAPGQVGIDLFGGQVVRRRRRAAEPHGRIGLLHRRNSSRAPFTLRCLPS